MVWVQGLSSAPRWLQVHHVPAYSPIRPKVWTLCRSQWRSHPVGHRCPPDRSCLIRPLLALGSTGRKSLNQVISGSGFPLAAQSMVAVRVRSTTFNWGPMSMLGKPGGSWSSGSVEWGRWNRSPVTVADALSGCSNGLPSPTALPSLPPSMAHSPRPPWLLWAVGVTGLTGGQAQRAQSFHLLWLSPLPSLTWDHTAPGRASC